MALPKPPIPPTQEPSPAGWRIGFGLLLLAAPACRQNDPAAAEPVVPVSLPVAAVPTLGLTPPCEQVVARGCPAGEPTVFVAPGGDDSAKGTKSQPFASLSRALANQAQGTIRVLAGTYRERVSVPARARSRCEWLSIVGEPGATLTATGAGASPRDDLLYLENAEQVCVSGLTIQGASGLNDASGVRVFGRGRSIWLLNNTIEGLHGRSAMGITVYGTDGAGISNLIIDGNQIRDCEPAPSEALVINGNVSGFLISNNIVENVNNIGIDVIGGEEWLSHGHPRGGAVHGNRVTDANSNYEDGAAAGIYVDGASDLTIERNQVSGCDFGIEIGAENAGAQATRITVRNNFIFNNFKGGLIVGGYEATAGRVVDSQLLHNSLYANNRPGDTTRFGYRGAPNGELILQYVSGMRVHNNIFFAAAGAEAYVATWGHATDLDLARNLYFTAGESVLNPPRADGQALVADPQFVAPAAGDLHLKAESPAIDTATSPQATDDFDSQRRSRSAADLGADEFVVGDAGL